MFELRPEEIKGCVCGGSEGGKEREEHTHSGASQKYTQWGIIRECMESSNDCWKFNMLDLKA